MIDIIFNGGNQFDHREKLRAAAVRGEVAKEAFCDLFSQKRWWA